VTVLQGGELECPDQPPARVLLCIARDPGVRLRDSRPARAAPSAAPAASSPARPQPAAWRSRKTAAATATRGCGPGRRWPVFALAARQAGAAAIFAFPLRIGGDPRRPVLGGLLNEYERIA
jgi:hypothetical protein